MCGRYYIAEDDAAEELRQIIEAVNRRNPDAKTGGEIRPGDTVPVLANSPSLQPGAYAITAHEPENMEAAFNVTGERRKVLVEAVKAFVDAPAVYQNAPSFAYVIGDYTVSKTGTVSGPVNEALMAALNANGFIVD